MIVRLSILLAAGLTFACADKKGTPEEPQPATSAGDEAPKDTKAEPPATKEEAKPAETPYRVRGIFRGYHESTGLADIHHESIPSFKDREGKTTGMMAMQMSFRVADGVAMNELAPGDKIEFEFVTEWDESPPIKIISVSKLAADIELGI